MQPTLNCGCSADVRSSDADWAGSDFGMRSAWRIIARTSTRGSGAIATSGSIASEAINDQRTIINRRAGWRQTNKKSTTTLKKSAVDKVASKRIEAVRSSHSHTVRVPTFQGSAQKRRKRPQRRSGNRAVHAGKDRHLPRAFSVRSRYLLICADSRKSSSLFGAWLFLKVRFEERLVLSLVNHRAKSIQLFGSR